MPTLRPHDLLWIDDPAGLQPDGALPDWATAEWLAQAPLVVRREATCDAASVPVGLRGRTRSQRVAAWVPAATVRRVVTPEDIARGGAWRERLQRNPLPALRALAHLAPRLEALGLGWGVTGGAGFTLASGLDVLRPDSDLDLLLRAPEAAAAPALRSLATALGEHAMRIDVQVETVRGAFALAEWLRTGGPVMLKTPHGPRLVPDPWNLGDGSA